jgi:two-component system chemotaxis response regulator CheY
MDKEKKNTKILLIDDFEIVRLMLRNALGDLGLTRIEEAEDGKEAMAKLMSALNNGEPFNLAFCDWNMPVMNGIEFIKACRAVTDFEHIPIIMITAEAEAQNISLALFAGASDYVIKPIAQDVLEKKVNKILSKRIVQAA